MRFTLNCQATLNLSWEKHDTYPPPHQFLLTKLPISGVHVIHSWCELLSWILPPSPTPIVVPPCWYDEILPILPYVIKWTKYMLRQVRVSCRAISRGGKFWSSGNCPPPPPSPPDAGEYHPNINLSQMVLHTFSWFWRNFYGGGVGNPRAPLPLPLHETLQVIQYNTIGHRHARY